MKQTIRKTITVLLALVMVLTLLPTVTVTARADGPISLGNETIPTLSDSETPLTLEAETGGTILVNNPKPGMQYSLNGGPKTDVTADAINVSAGNKVAFYGNANSYQNTVISGGTAQCYIYGNIMSLIDATNFASATALTEGAAFQRLFNENTCLLSHPSRKLALPATTLTESCYEHMFDGCTSLTTAPELPATTLAVGCYDSMFLGCTGLTTAPELPATTLAVGCYANMFAGCQNLNSVTCLAKDISAQFATGNWLYYVASTGTFTKAPGTDWPTGFNGIPENWTVKDYTTPVTYLDAQVDDTTHAVTYTPAACTDYTPVAFHTDVWSGGWYVVKENVTIDNTVTFSGDVRLILCDGATLTVNSVTQYANAITNSGSGSLTVYAQSTDDNAGALKATAQKGSAIRTDGCAVTINGGKVTATMGADTGSDQAGIEVNNGSLTINGGVVNASVTGFYIGIRAENAPVTINGGSVTAEANLAGINLDSTVLTMNGGSLVANSRNSIGIDSVNSSLAITGGTVTVESRSYSINFDTVSISGGDLTTNNTIIGIKNVSITGGDVKAGGYYAIYANNGTVTISGGTVEATGLTYAIYANNGTVTISGGTVEATGQTYGIMTVNGNVTITGGDVTASATNAENAMAVNSVIGAVVIGPGLRVDAGADKNSAVKVTKTFPMTHPQKWAHIYRDESTESTYTLTIPAAVTVSGAGWNATGGVGASGELATGKKLTVTAASGDAFALVCEGKGQIGYYLAATATDTQPTTTWTFTALDATATDTQPMGVIVSEADYSSARPGTYTDTVTFTAQVEDDDTLPKLTFVADVWSIEIKDFVQVDVDFYYVPDETWKQAIENHPTENAGWSFSDYLGVFDNAKGVQYTDETRGIRNFYILDDNADLVDYDLKIDPTGSYTLD